MSQGGRGHLTVNYTCTQSFIIMLSFIEISLVDSKLAMVKLYNQYFNVKKGVIMFIVIGDVENFKL